MNTDNPQSQPVSRRRTRRRQDLQKSDPNLIGESERQVSPGPAYRVCHGCISLGGDRPKIIANFTASITKSILIDDGLQQSRLLVISGKLADGQDLPEIMVSADKFDDLGWIMELWGPQAIVHAGKKAHLKVAIQQFSDEAPEERRFSHTGWVQLDGNWCFLHAGGAIGASGPVHQIATELPSALSRFELPSHVAPSRLQEAIRESLNLLNLAPDRITVPLLAGVYRAVLGPVDFSLFLVGSTGIFKSQMAALMQQHFGLELDSSHFPANWSSTANALEAISFHAKDVPLVIDDYVPSGNHLARNAMQQIAERIIRAQGNSSGRQRLNADSSMRVTKSPRCLILGTGEEAPAGQSLQGRMLILPVAAGDVDMARLTEVQEVAQTGTYAVAMSGFVTWVAGRYEELINRVRKETASPESRFRIDGLHTRTPRIAASLMIALQIFLEFAVEQGAITGDESEAIDARAWSAMREAVEHQHQTQRQTDPVERFIALILSLLSTGRAQLVPVRRLNSVACGTSQSLPDSPVIGWKDDTTIYLDPEAAFAEVSRLAREQGEPFAVHASTLWQRMNQAGLLVTEPSQKTYLHRLPSPHRAQRGLRLAPGVLELPNGTVAVRPSERSTMSSPAEDEPVSPPRCRVRRSSRRQRSE